MAPLEKLTSRLKQGHFSLVKRLVERGVITSKRLRKAFEAVDRRDFVAPGSLDQAYGDYPLPIGFGQTISQPSTVAFMLELLEVQPGSRVLDVGCGSGYTTALLAYLVGNEGSVWGLDTVPELIDFCSGNLRGYSLPQIHLFKENADNLNKLTSEKFDRILVNASAQEIPQVLLDDLARGGVMVVPVGHQMIKIKKDANGELSQEAYDGFAFVPYIGA